MDPRLGKLKIKSFKLKICWKYLSRVKEISTHNINLLKHFLKQFLQKKPEKKVCLPELKTL